MEGLLEGRQAPGCVRIEDGRADDRVGDEQAKVVVGGNDFEVGVEHCHRVGSGLNDRPCDLHKLIPAERRWLLDHGGPCCSRLSWEAVRDAIFPRLTTSWH